MTLLFQRRVGGDEEVPQKTEGRKSSRMEGTESAKASQRLDRVLHRLRRLTNNSIIVIEHCAVWDIVLSALCVVAIYFGVSKTLVWEQLLSSTSVPWRGLIGSQTW